MNNTEKNEMSNIVLNLENLENLEKLNTNNLYNYNIIIILQS